MLEIDRNDCILIFQVGLIHRIFKIIENYGNYIVHPANILYYYAARFCRAGPGPCAGPRETEVSMFILFI